MHANVISRQPTLIFKQEPTEWSFGAQFGANMSGIAEEGCWLAILPVEEDAPKQEEARKSATRADNKNLH